VKERTRELRWINEELSRALRHLKETQKQLVMQEKLASLGALTAGIAHEIKNPLQFVNNFAELSVGLAGDLEGSVRSQEARLDADAIADIEETLGFLTDNVRKIHEHGKRVEDIVNGMLSHARNAPSAREDADVNALVVGSINLAVHGLRGQDPELSVGLRTEYDGAAGRARLSPQEISRVLINVINNAVYATAARKRAAGEGYAPALLVSTRGLPDRVEIRVRDNGTGIAADVLGKIFVPFFTTKPAGQGTGLGLSISHDIVQSHHGEMHVESALGEFTEVVIALPRRVGGTEPPAAAAG
jgi:signal transduction histidine kinase